MPPLHIQTIDHIQEPVNPGDDIHVNNLKSSYVEVQKIRTKNNYIHPIVLLLYRIIDGKHDFGGGGESDRSYMN